MQEKYDIQGAKYSLGAFQYIVNSDKCPHTVRKSTKAMLFLMVIAYKQSCSNYFLRKCFPVSNINDALSILENANLIKRERNSGKMVTFYITDEIKKVLMDEYEMYEWGKKPSKYNLYLFANALLNIPRYINEYKILSWNMLLSMVEITLSINNGCANVSIDNMTGIRGEYASKNVTRKQLIEAGVIKRISHKSPMYKVNQEAYLLTHA